MFEYLTEEDWKSGEVNTVTIVTITTFITLALAPITFAFAPAETLILAFLSVVLFFSVRLHYWKRRHWGK